jgi:hypothetical protein
MAIWYIMRPFGIFCGNLVYFVAIWYIVWLFGIFIPVLVCCTKKNLATLIKRDLAGKIKMIFPPASDSGTDFFVGKD